MKYFHCPVNGLNCPHYKNEIIIDNQKETCVCTLENPMSNCNDFFDMWCEYVSDECISDNYTDDN